MAISAHAPAYGHKQRVNTPRLVILEVVLDQLPHVGTAGQLLFLSLVQNYTSAPSRLCHELVFFDVGTADALDHHVSKMSKVADKLQKG